nr:hypothetical protein [Tanacetum cinerariifolium]
EVNRHEVLGYIGGNFLDKIPHECLSIIESKSKVRYSRSRITDSRANMNAALSSSSPSNSLDLQQIAASLEDKLDIHMNRFKKSLNDMKNSFVTPTAPIKAVEEEAACAYHEEHMMHDCVQLDHVVNSHDEYTSDNNIILCDHWRDAYEIEAYRLFRRNVPVTTLVSGSVPARPTAYTLAEALFLPLWLPCKEIKDVFEELEAEVAQHVVVRKHDAIELKNLLIANDNLIAKCLSQEVFCVATNSELNVARFTDMHVTNTTAETCCLALEVELANLHETNNQDNQTELISHFSKLEVSHLNLQLKYQNLKDQIGNSPPTPDKDTPDFDSVFVIAKMQAFLQGKDNVIRQLKKELSQLQVTRQDTDRALRVQTTDSQITKLTDQVTHLQAQNHLFRAENDKIKQYYKELYDSIKITRAKHIEQVTKVTTENMNLKTGVSKATVNPLVSARDKHAIDVEPIVPRHRNNRNAHLEYLRHLKESVETIHDIVKEAKVTKACYLQEVIPFFKTLKDNFKGIQKGLTKEVKEMKDVFEELEAEVVQYVVDRKHDAIELKNILIANDNLIAKCLSQEVFCVASNSKLNVTRFTDMHVTNTTAEIRCLALEAELANLHQIGNSPPTLDKNTPDFDSVFVIGKMQASLQGKDNVIRQLKKELSQLQVTRRDTDRALRVQTTDSQITKLTDQVTKVTTKNLNLKTDVSKAMVNPLVSARDKHAIDVEPIVPHLRNNRNAHLDYLRHLKESVETIRDIGEEAKVVRPLDRSIVSACRYTMHSQELLEYAIGTCPHVSQPRAKQLAHIPLIRKKQVIVAQPSNKLDSTTHPHVVTVTSQKTNVLVPPSTGVDCCPIARESQPMRHVKPNRILPAKGDTKLPIDDQPRKNKSHLRTSTRIDSSSRLKRTVINLHSNSVC